MTASRLSPNPILTLLFCALSFVSLAQITQLSGEPLAALQQQFELLKSTAGTHAVASGVSVSVDELGLLAQLDQAAMRSANGAQAVVARFPTQSGESKAFRLKRVSSLHPDLQARYPKILAYEGVSADDGLTTIRAEYSPAKGWTSLISAANGSQTFLASRGTTAATRKYTLVQKADVLHADFECLNDDDAAPIDATAAVVQAGDCQFRKYRIAITCTGEYAIAVAGSNPQVADVLAAMNVAMNRVNGVYERDFGVTMEIIPENDQLIFLNGSTDPYTEGAPRSLINESQTNIDAIVGQAAYDIGHIFSTQGGGLAALGVPCSNSKGRGVTGINNPTGDGFYIDYVAHEIGHQFGATHTFYNSCGGNRTASTAYEPGSGSTIMAYAGICAPNVQNRSDDYFHAASIAQVSAYITGFGNTCAELIPTQNNPPVVSVPDALSIPIGTAFELTAIGTDPDGDPLSYCWEQYDNVVGANQPPQSTNVDGPLFRSLQPSTSPTRRFPSGNFNTYEVLPTVARDLNFRVTVRDNNAVSGCTAEADLLINTVGTEPFRITNFNSTSTLSGLENYTVEWDVAGTTDAPINTPTVNVYLSLDGGDTYDFTLASVVANTGSAVVTIPNVNSTTARFVVKAVDNVFLDINDANLTIQEVQTATYSLSTDEALLTSCDGINVQYLLEIESFLGFSESVTLTATGLPAGTSATFTRSSGSGNYISVITLLGADLLPNGSYTFTVEANSTSFQKSLDLTLIKKSLPLLMAQPLMPADGSDVGVVINEFSWTYDQSQGEVRLQVSADPSFQTGVFTALYTTDRVLLSGLTPGVYFWRTAYANECGNGAFSPLQSFRKIELDDDTFINTNSVTIGGGSPGSYTSTVNVSRAGLIYQIEAGTNITHSYVGDIRGSATLPGSLEKNLFGRPSNGSCSGDNINVVFADDAPRTASDFIGTCTPNIPSVVGTFQGIAPFYTSLPREAAGDYTLTVDDLESADGGAIESWGVTLWYADIRDFSETVSISTLTLPSAQLRSIAPANLRASAATVTSNDIVWVIKQTTPAGVVSRSDVALGVGSAFTQQDIDQGLIEFQHDASSGLSSGELVLDLVIDGEGYQANRILPIQIVANTLGITAQITQQPACFDEPTGVIVAQATGGTTPYQFSINGSAFNNLNTFSNLPSGSYVVTARDANGFSVSSLQLNITYPPELTLSTSANGNVVTASGQGGTGSLQYQIDGGALQSSNVFNGVSNGTHIITVQDANGCTKQSQIIVSVDDLLALLDITQGIRCNGDLGTLRADAAGGVPPYSYALNGGAPQTSTSFPNLAAGTYTLTVTDNSGQSATSNAVTVFEPAVLEASAMVMNSTIIAAGSGGTTPYTYSIDGFSFQNDATFNGLTNGAYTVTLRDANICQAATTATVAVNNIIVSLTLNNNLSCAGAGDGSISAVASNGNAPYTYSLNGGAFGSSGTFNNLDAGNYVVTARDASGLETSSVSLVVTEPDVLQISVAASGNMATATATGGTSPYRYRIGNSALQSSNQFGPLAQGTYSITAVDANGCMDTRSVVISASDLDVTVTLLVGQETCPGANDGAVSLMGLDGEAPYTYSIDGTNFQSDGVFEALAAATYTGTVRDALGDLATTTFTIAPQQAPTVDVAVNGSQVTLSNFQPASSSVRYSFDGGATFSAMASGYIYQAGNTDVLIRYGSCEFVQVVTVTDPLQLSNSALNACADDVNATSIICIEGGVGAYQISTTAGSTSVVSSSGCDGAYEFNLGTALSSSVISIIDATGATRTLNVTIDIASEIIPDASIDNGVLTATASGGTPPYRYSLDEGNTFQQSPVFDPAPTSNYLLIVEDANGCQGSIEVFIDAVINPAIIGLQVFPNPADERINIKHDLQGGETHYELTDATGRVVLAQASFGKRDQLDVANLPPGFYTLTVNHELGRTHVAVVVQ